MTRAESLRIFIRTVLIRDAQSDRVDQIAKKFMQEHPEHRQFARFIAEIEQRERARLMNGEMMNGEGGDEVRAAN